MFGYTGVRLTPNRIAGDDGRLIVLGCTISRSGPQSYSKKEVVEDSTSDELVTVWRPREEVTAAAAVASAEGKTICLSHPTRFIDADT